MEKRTVAFTKLFHSSIMEIWKYIGEKSVQNADKFLEDLNPVIEDIIKNPDAHRPFKLFANQHNVFRVRNYKRSYHIIFKVSKSKLIFVIVSHAKRGADFYKKLQQKGFNN
jgi:mRNA-degrading endonuclease RelE of RelBE toxin-antitoxin system